MASFIVEGGHKLHGSITPQGASGRSTVRAGKKGNACDTYTCGGSDYRDRSYSISFDLCN